MKNITRYSALSLVMACLTLAQADTTHVGNYTADYTKTGDINFTAESGGVSFRQNYFSGLTNPDGTPLGGLAQSSGGVTATFHADPGLIFDKIYFGGMYGGMIQIQEAGASSALNWTVTGGTFTGPSTYGGSNNGS